MFIAVDLPEPDGPMIATNSPRVDGEVDAGQRVHRGVARAVDLGDAAQLDQRIGWARAAVTGRLSALGGDRVDDDGADRRR